MSAVSGVEISAAEIVAVSCEELTNAVGLGLPFQFTVDWGIKPEPFTVSVNPGEPGDAATGTTGILI